MAAMANAQVRDHPDPLQTRRIASEWFRHLPALDVIGRLEHVVRAFDGMRHACTLVDLDRLAAIGYLDASLEVDQRRLVKWYLENLHGTALLADRFWQVGNDVNRGFVFAYHAALEAALVHARDRHWQPWLPLVIARLVHFQGIDAKLRLFRNDHWIPAKWAQLHQLFLRAADLAVERVPTAHEGSDPLAPRWSVEQEYIHVLLLHRLDTGNLAPADLDWASGQLRSWCRSLSLETAPRTEDGFYVDLSGTAGLVRRSGKDRGDKVGYLDTTPLIERLEAVVASLTDADASPHAVNPVARQRLAALEKIRPALAPRRSADLRRHPRIPVDVEATIRVGLSRITADLAAASTATSTNPDGPRLGGHVEQVDTGPAPREMSADEAPAMAAAANDASGAPERAPAAAVRAPAAMPYAMQDEVEEIEIQPVLSDLRAAGRRAPAPAAPLERPTIADDPVWRVADRSVAGWRLVAPRGGGKALPLGTLVAVRARDVGDWMLGVVRRVRKGTNEQFEAGMSLIAARAVPVTLRGRRPANEDMGFEVDGVETAAMGAHFDGLYLMPPASADGRTALRTLIIPSSEHFEGRSLFLSTMRSNYAVTLRHLVDQQGEWSWVAIQVSSRAQRLPA